MRADRSRGFGIGKRRQVTSTGNLRRADIEPFSALLGVKAVGVAKLPDPERFDFGPRDPNVPAREETVFSAQSLPHVPVPAAWWEALRIADVLNISPRRVYPAPDAEAWRTGSIMTDQIDMLVGTFIGELLIGPSELYRFGAEHTTAEVQMLVETLDPDAEPAYFVRNSDPLAWDWPTMLRPAALRTGQRLADLGILERKGDRLIAPPELRGTIARGILLTMSLLEARLDDAGDDPDFA